MKIGEGTIVGGVFFTQNRPGKDAKIFKAVKFKTMTDERDADGNLLPDAQRITKIGQLFRTLSIDELPQLWNVLKGDMALVARGHFCHNTSRCILRNRHAVMKSVPASRAGRRSTAETIFRGQSKEVRAGCVVCRPSYDVAGYQDSLPHS